MILYRRPNPALTALVTMPPPMIFATARGSPGRIGLITLALPGFESANTCVLRLGYCLVLSLFVLPPNRAIGMLSRRAGHLSREYRNYSVKLNPC
jgi:hypothetical protein